MATQVTPDSHAADAELGAVWYAANQYYEASFNAGVEYVGIVYKRADGKYVVTAHKGTSLFHCRVPREGFPGLSPTAVWHTHVPLTEIDKTGELDMPLKVAEVISALFGGGTNNLSSADKSVADELTRMKGRTISVYMCTKTLIKRYRPGQDIKEWPKDPPGRMAENGKGAGAGK